MADAAKQSAPAWLNFFFTSGTVEIAFRRAETWNEGVTRKRQKQPPPQFVTLTARAGDGEITLSGEPEAVRSAVTVVTFTGLAEAYKEKLIEPCEMYPDGKLFVYLRTPKQGESK